jgi:hypothetical protein
VSKFNFSGVLFNTATQNKRASALVATLSAIMVNVANATFVVQFTEEPNCELQQNYLRWLAEASGNVIHFLTVSGDTPIIHTKHTPFLNTLTFDYFVNLDDDVILPYSGLKELHEGFCSSSSEVITLGTVDCTNSRNYVDWDLVHYETAQDAETTRGTGKAKHHFINKIEHDTSYRHISQLYALPRNIWEDKEIWEPILRRFNVKGVRGADIMLEQALASKYTIRYISGVEGLHFGMETAYYDEQWKSSDPIIEGRVDIQDSKNIKGQ